MNMVVVVAPIGSQYIKKEDLEFYVKNRRMNFTIMSIVFTIAVGLIIFFIGGAVNKFTISLNDFEKFLIGLAPIVFIAGLVMLWVYIAMEVYNNRWVADLFEKTKKYDNKEMINLAKYMGKEVWILPLMTMLITIIGMFCYIYPIYSSSQREYHQMDKYFSQ